MKILSIFGTRPEAIKMAPIVKSLNNNFEFESRVCVTAQHRQMLDQVLEIFKIYPHWDLDIMANGQDLFDVTSRVLLGVKSVINEFIPDIILVHGDTSTAMASALAAYYKRIPVGHIEAGLRTNNIYSPWPEEINRQIIARIAKWHFAPTEAAKENLLKENVNKDNIFVTGNTVIDALQFVIYEIENNYQLKRQISNDLIKELGIEIEEKEIILVTGHRRENFGQGFINICEALKELAVLNKGICIIYPVHLNPNVLNPVKAMLKNIDNIKLINPLKYLQFIYLMNKSKIILTDSGGIQEEAPSLGKPVLVMRDNTERPEAVKAGTVKIVGTKKELIISEVERLLYDHEYYKKMAQAKNPYGDGKAAIRIIDVIKNSKI